MPPSPSSSRIRLNSVPAALRTPSSDSCLAATALVLRSPLFVGGAIALNSPGFGDRQVEPSFLLAPCVELLSSHCLTAPSEEQVGAAAVNSFAGEALHATRSPAKPHEMESPRLSVNAEERLELYAAPVLQLLLDAFDQAIGPPCHGVGVRRGMSDSRPPPGAELACRPALELQAADAARAPFSRCSPPAGRATGSGARGSTSPRGRLRGRGTSRPPTCSGTRCRTRATRT